MMLENLFAHEAQGQAFLAMIVCGLLLGAILQLTSAFRRRWPAAGFLWDGLFALTALMMALTVMLRFGGGVRAYALLGVIIGILLYFAGVSRIVSGMANLAKHILMKTKKTEAPKAGVAQADRESISLQTADAAVTEKKASSNRRGQLSAR